MLKLEREKQLVVVSLKLELSELEFGIVQLVLWDYC